MNFNKSQLSRPFLSNLNRHKHKGTLRGFLSLLLPILLSNIALSKLNHHPTIALAAPQNKPGPTSTLYTTTVTIPARDRYSPVYFSSPRTPVVITSTPTYNPTLLTDRAIASASPRLQLPEQPYKQAQLNQPKFYKFTLTAGKFWRFNIKANTLLASSSQKNKELRLHRNISSTNFIIDDDHWFQYNPQQQQLFAWPCLQAKPATYYFVLVPSGQNIEASEDENGINNIEIAASIVVELIRPLNVGSRVNDVDQLLDYKFSLDKIHRQATYPLLLNQIVAVFEYLVNAAPLQDTFNETRFISDQNSTVIRSTNPPSLTNIPPSSIRLNDYLLINSTLNVGGEHFSITWTHEPSLSNNTIAPHNNECRLSSLLDNLDKLSRPTLASPVPLSQASTTAIPLQLEDLNLGVTVYYPVQVSSQNSHAIFNALSGGGGVGLELRLTLNNSCRKSKIYSRVVGAHKHAKDKEILSENKPNNNNSSISNEETSVISSTSIPLSTLASLTPTSEPFLEVSSTIHPTTTTERSILTSTPRQQSTQSTLATGTDHSQTLALHEHQQQQKQQQKPRGEEAPSIVERSSFVPTTPQATATTISTIKVSDNVNTSLDGSSDTSDLLLAQSSNIQSDRRSLLLSTTKTPPQAKSLANYFEIVESNSNSNHTVPIMSSTPITTPTSSLSTSTATIFATQVPSMNSNTTTTSIPFVLNYTDNVPILTDINSTSASIVANESSLNEDLIGILNDIMEYVVSVAVPIAIIIGAVLLLSILIALCSLRAKRKKSQQFGSGDRFKHRYGSERKAFLKNSSRPVILESDQKSLSMGGTPQHHYVQKTSQMDEKRSDDPSSKGKTYLKMTKLSHGKEPDNNGSTTTSFWLGSGGAAQAGPETRGAAQGTS